MKLPFFIAKRYFFSKKSHNVINVISWISVMGIAVGTAALVIILSVFNGFEDLVLSLYNSFDPDIKITACEGKYYTLSDEQKKGIHNLNGVEVYSEIVEENAGLEYGEQQFIAVLKGVDDNYFSIVGLDSMVIDGQCFLTKGEMDFAFTGAGVAHFLNLNLYDKQKLISAYIPRRTKEVSFMPEEAFNKGFMLPSGIFSIEQQIDEKYVIVPVRLMRKLLDLTQEVTAIEIKLVKGSDANSIKQKIAEILGETFKIQTRDEQHEFVNKIMQSEKWAVFMILTFVLLLATFNIIGSLTILILEKKNDIQTLRALGANDKLINRIFLTEGMFVSSFGLIIGLITGFIVCIIQQWFGIVKLGGGNLIIDAYPVRMYYLDFILILITVLAITFLANLLPVRWFSKRFLRNGNGFMSRQ